MTNKIEALNPMEAMEIYIRSMANSFYEFDTDTNVWPNSKLMTRVMKIKAGEIILGKVHKEWNINILASGSIRVTNDPRQPHVQIDAPYVFETGPGSQKLVLAVTDCVFMNVMISENETPEEAVNRMAEDTRVTKLMEKDRLWQ